MRALVEPAALEVEIEPAHHRQADRLLLRQRERADRPDHRRLGLLALAHLADQARQPGAQVAEDALDLGTGHARLEAVEQRVVGRETGGLGQVHRLLAGDLHHRTEVLDEAGPVVGRTLRAPGMLAARGGQRAALDQRGGQRVGGEPVAAHLAQVGALVVRERLVLGARQQIAQRRVGALGMHQRLEFGHRGRAGLVALRGHVGGLVPAGDRAEMLETVQALEAGFEIGVGRRVGAMDGAAHQSVPLQKGHGIRAVPGGWPPPLRPRRPADRW